MAEAASDRPVPGAAAGPLVGPGAGDPKSLAGRASTESPKPVVSAGKDRKASCVRGMEAVGISEKCQGLGTIPSSIVLSAQPESQFRVVAGGKAIEFIETPAY